jgi:hypothetical protein
MRTTPSSSSSTNVGAIAGGVVGGVAFVAVVAVGIFLFTRKDKQRRTRVLGGVKVNDKHVTVLPTVYQPESQTGLGSQHESGVYDESALQSPYGHAPSTYLPPSYEQTFSAHN